MDESLKNIVRSFLYEIEYSQSKTEKYLSFCFHAIAARMTKRQFGCTVRKYRRMHRSPAQ